MFFRKCVHEIIDDIAKKVRINPDEFLDFPDLGCKIASHELKYDNGRPLSLDFAEAQLLTRKLSKDYDANIRLPTLKEDYTAFQKLSNKERLSSEWNAELLDGSFLMLNPEVRVVKHPRKYDFQSPFTIVETRRYSDFIRNGNLCWFGISKDQYDRAAFTSSFNGERYSVGAIPPLSKDCLNVRILIDENKK